MRIYVYMLRKEYRGFDFYKFYEGIAVQLYFWNLVFCWSEK